MTALQRTPIEQLTALLDVSSALSGSLDVRAVMQVAIEGAVDVLELDSGAIYLLDGDDMYLGATTPPLPPDFPDEFRHARLDDHPHIAECLEEACPVHVDDTSTAAMSDSERRVCEQRGLKSILYVPIVDDGQPVGTFIVGATEEARAFGRDEVVLCRMLSHQISLALANARLFESLGRASKELERAYDATLAGWSLTLELRDKETRGHTDRVEALTMRLVADLGIPEHQWEDIRRGTLLHDIGKMVVPDAILRKPGPLDDEEWLIMREHPERAREMLSSIDYLSSAIDIPYCHHERWDGSGYPQGLRGEEIPLSARIFAIIDVYDALTSDRPYRSAWTRERALEHIASQSGKHFDPRVVEAFLEVMRDSSW